MFNELWLDSVSVSTSRSKILKIHAGSHIIRLSSRLRIFLIWPGHCRCLLLGGGRVWLAVPGVHLGVAGGEDEHVGHEDEHAGGEHGHDDRQDDVQLAVLLGMVIVYFYCCDFSTRMRDSWS